MLLVKDWKKVIYKDMLEGVWDASFDFDHFFNAAKLLM